MNVPAPRVRFAPSPTGFLHVGGARTALFNWLFARRSGGTFILRIEDTDRERSSEEMVRAILEGLTWLGLDWDEGPHFQSEGSGRHVAKAHEILAAGGAYKCWCTPEALAGRRSASEAEGRPWKYDRACLALPDGERARFTEMGAPFCVRLRVPDGATSYRDLVHGEVKFDNSQIEDLVLLRSDGSPTYNLACVADDSEMRITHVIRGDDHISNTPKQILLYQALGLPIPEFGHLPLILGENRKRLSKRHGAVSVTEYRKMGYLPEALFNFLALLGWSPGDDREILSREEAISLFSFEGVSPKNAVFGHDKLDWMNGQYLSRVAAASLVGPVRGALQEAGLWRAELEADRRDWFVRLLDLLKTRSRTVAGLAEDARPFLTETFDYDPEAVQKHFKSQDLPAHLRALASAVEGVHPYDEPTVESAVRGLSAKLGIAAGKLIHPARVALTGKAVSPGIFEVMVMMGKAECASRLRRAASAVESGSVPAA